VIPGESEKRLLPQGVVGVVNVLPIYGQRFLLSPQLFRRLDLYRMELIEGDRAAGIPKRNRRHQSSFAEGQHRVPRKTPRGCGIASRRTLEEFLRKPLGRLLGRVELFTVSDGGTSPDLDGGDGYSGDHGQLFPRFRAAQSLQALRQRLATEKVLEYLNTLRIRLDFYQQLPIRVRGVYGTKAEKRESSNEENEDGE